VVVAEAVVVVVMGVGVAVALVRARAVGGNEDNCSNSDGRGPYNNQLKGPAEEIMVAVKVTATETATAMVKATEKDKTTPPMMTAHQGQQQGQQAWDVPQG
jgi:hypothetical protein